MLVMAYQLWHVSYGRLVMACALRTKELVRESAGARTSADTRAHRGILGRAYWLWHVAYGILVMAY